MLKKIKKQYEQEVKKLKDAIEKERRKNKQLMDCVTSQVNRAEYEKLKSENEILKRQIFINIEMHKAELKFEQERYDSLIASNESLKLELEILRLKPAAGRKVKITNDVMRQVRDMRADGATYQKISDTLELAIGTVYKAAHLAESDK